MYYKRKTQSRSRNHCCLVKTIFITYSECVFRSLSFQHAKHTRRFMLSVFCLALTTVSSILSHKQCDFRGKKIIKHKMCVLIFSTTLSK